MCLVNVSVHVVVSVSVRLCRTVRLYVVNHMPVALVEEDEGGLGSGKGGVKGWGWIEN